MADEQLTQTEEVLEPTGEVTPEPAATAEVSATSEPEEEPIIQIADDATPEEKAKQEKINFSFAEQRRKRREAEREKHDLELKLAEERGRREAIERYGMRQEAAPVQSQPEPQIPPMQLPPRPDPQLWTDEDGYEDQDKKIELMADWRADCKMAERDHRHNLEKAQAEQLAMQEKALTFLNSVSAQYPDFNVLARTGPQPTDNVMAFILNTENSEKVAYYLAKNPQELAKLNGMQLRDAAISIGRLDAKMSLPSPPSKTIPNAPAPINPVTPSGPLSVSRESMSTEDWIAARDREEFGDRA